MKRLACLVAAFTLTATGLATAGASHAGIGSAAPVVTTVTQKSTQSFRVNFDAGAVLEVRIAATPKSTQYRVSPPGGSPGPWAELPGTADRDCGALKVRAAGSGVAVIALCDTGTYYEDQAPTGSMAIYSPDNGLTWLHAPLKGEAYEEPGISPDGSKAVWPIHGGRYLSYQPAEDFRERSVSTPGEEYTVTATIADSGQVDYLYGGPAGKGRCALQIKTRTGDGAVRSSSVALKSACSDTALENLDANTVRFNTGLYRTLIGRADAASPWAITSTPPIDRAALPQTPATAILDTAAGGIAVGIMNGSVSSEHFTEATDSWSALQPITNKPEGRCKWTYPTWGQVNGSNIGHSVKVVTLVCRASDGSTGRTAFVSTDDQTMTADYLGIGASGFTSRMRYFVIPRRTNTLIFSTSNGRVVVPHGVNSRCDLVSASSPTSLVMIENDDSRRRPYRLQAASTTNGWTTLRTLRWKGPRGCARARNFSEGFRDRFVLLGPLNGRKGGQQVVNLGRKREGAPGPRWQVVRDPLFYF